MATFDLQINILALQLQNIISIGKDQIKFLQKLSTKDDQKQDHINVEIEELDIWEYKGTISNIYRFITDPRRTMFSNLSQIADMVRPKTQLLWQVHMFNPQSYYNDCIKYVT